MNSVPRLKLLTLVLVCGACKPTAIAYPDRPKLVAAQKSWCDALARSERPDAQTWRHGAGCEAAVPTGSATFVAQMARCYAKHHEEHGANSIDLGGLVSVCADEWLSAAEPGDVSQAEPVRARCTRMARCEQVSGEICVNVFEQLSPPQKAALTSAYSLEAQHAIAACLDETPCSPDEDATRNACYEAAQKHRVWLPPM